MNQKGMNEELKNSIGVGSITVWKALYALVDLATLEISESVCIQDYMYLLIEIS